MNLEASLLLDTLSVTKTALTTPNPANAVVTHLVDTLKLMPLFGLAGVFITGSNVWRPALGLPTIADSDIDIMVVGDEPELKREGIIKALDLAGNVAIATGPSMSDARDVATLPGWKYLRADGRTVDIWGMEYLHRALQQYPEHSHASSRMAWDCEHGCLIMFPNTAYKVQPLPVPSNYGEGGVGEGSQAQVFNPAPGVAW